MHYVISDIHGDQEAFDRILSMIRLTGEDYFYILGDVIDRNPDGIELLARIRRMPNTRLFLGNHELMMINAMRNPDDLHLLLLWYQNGGRVTHEKFRLQSERAREDLLSYLESLPVQENLTVCGRDYLLVHAAPQELFETEESMFEDPVSFAVWHRLSASAKLPEEQTVIYGHTITLLMQEREGNMRIYHGDRRMDIDCGCAYPQYGGQLACIRLEDGREYYSKDGEVPGSAER